jgi:hypothetical protein
MALSAMKEQQDSSDSDQDPSSDDGFSAEDSAAADEVDEKGEETLAALETKHVNAGKALVFGVLLLAAVAMGYFTFWFTSEDEKNTFETSVGCHSLVPIVRD